VRCACAERGAATGIGITAVTFVVVGLVFIVCARYVVRLDTSALLRDGVPAGRRTR
jgi:hypothetical protein